ncbi:hypothetical protein JL722_1241 [Aureococcus anophagefferens]|nr:hypothetical protein JL722_1241 [Aureococcus anophagefferens]
MACKYNMKGESTAAKQKVEDVDDSAAVPTIRGELKAAFAAGDVSTRDFRMRQLLKFRDMLVAGRGPLLDALQQDLHKSHTEGWMMELNQLEHEAQEAIDSLDAWMRPERVGTNVVNVPGASYVHSDPLGVVLVIGAWNYPVLLSLAPVVGAIAAGNGVVLKLPSDKYSAATSAAIADLVGAWLDQRARVVAATAARRGRLDARWDHIFFTGGKTVGRMVAKAAAEHLCPTSLELGGKSPCTCVRPDYLLVDEAIAAFLRALKAEVAAFTAGASQSPYYGRIVNDRAFDRVAALVADARVRRSRARRRDGQGDAYVEPTPSTTGRRGGLRGVGPHGRRDLRARLPDLAVRVLDADALPVVAKREKPLSFYLFAGDAEVREKLQWATTSGAFVVNDVITHLGGSRRPRPRRISRLWPNASRAVGNSSLPFGGVGESGMGNYHGHYSFKTFSHQKAVLHKTPYLDLPARYPPYDSTKETMLAVLQHRATGRTASRSCRPR